jgi:hypothetical protein
MAFQGFAGAAAAGRPVFRRLGGHYPVWPVNGYAAPYQRCLGPEDGQSLWAILVRHGGFAYLCSHLLAFDVQVHAGVLQLVTRLAPGQYTARPLRQSISTVYI